MFRRIPGVVVWLFLCAPGYAQTLGTVTGAVKDQSNATIPGATVTAQNVATNAVRTQTSNEAGVYTFSAMPPGMYQVKAELQGFKTVQNNVELHVEEGLQCLQQPGLGRSKLVDGKPDAVRYHQHDENADARTADRREVQLLRARAG